MEYQYNNKKLGELQKRFKLTRSAIRAGLGIQNDVTVKRWLDGEDIYISRLIQFCKLFNVSPLEFINVDGVAMNEIKMQKNTVCNSDIIEDIQKKIKRNERLLDYYEKEIENKDKEIVELRILLSSK